MTICSENMDGPKIYIRDDSGKLFAICDFVNDERNCIYIIRKKKLFPIFRSQAQKVAGKNLWTEKHRSF